MTFNEFIKAITPEQINQWWQTITLTVGTEKALEDSCKYMFSKDNKVISIESALKSLSDYLNADLGDLVNSVDSRNNFCEKYGFTIVENLIYSEKEMQSFIHFYKTLNNNSLLFQEAINYLSAICTNNEIDPYKIRFALRESNKQAMFVLGMRAVFAFKEEDGKAKIGMIFDKAIFDKLKSELIVKDKEPFKGKPEEKVLVFFEINKWSEIPQDLIENNTREILLQYNLIKDTKRATWNAGSYTTNSVLKYLICKGQNVEEFIRNIQPVNYWVFQGNPKEFDIVKALEENALKTWRVKAHKDKIKKGDKVILWSGGKNAGVYALATIDSDVEILPEPEIEKSYYKDQMVYEDKERVFLKVDYNLFSQPVLKTELENYPWFSKMKVGSQGTNFTATKEEYESILKLISKMNKLIINISWNSKDWKEESQDKSNHEWVKNGGVPFESWNFASDAKENTEEHIFGYAKFTNNPKITGTSIFIFYSDKKIVGFYGNGTIVEKKVDDNILNLRGDQNLSFVLDNKIENIIEKGYLEDGKRIGQGGFNYLHKNETVIKILNEALSINPNQKDEITRLKEWFMKEIHPNDINVHNDTLIDVPLNQILYGPPGTGKTYNTVLEAAKIVTGNEFISYDEALTIFNENLNNQIEFITFHQNYSYEDFIQGIRPDTENGKELSFEKKDGIFKRIADRANKNLVASKNPAAAKKDFDVVFQELIKPLNDGDIEELEIKMKKSSFYISEIGEKSIEFRKNIGESQHTLSINTLRKMYDNGENDIIFGGLQPYYNPILALLLEKGKSSLASIKRKNYVIIIDEINRANISRVFGELITLIEEDKRSEGKIAMRVTLPSGDSFIVPSNLYIIGTMNTADKSIALLDIALRRRFEFVPKYPDPTVAGVHDSEILVLLNKAIQSRKGYDFTIGHAYFMGDGYSLEQTINKKVIPLLLEYFMNNEDEVIKIFKEANITIGDWPLKMIV